MNRAQLITYLTQKITSGNSDTKAEDVRQFLTELLDSDVNLEEDANQPGGYVALDNAGQPDLSLVLTPSQSQTILNKNFNLAGNTLTGSADQFSAALNDNFFQYVFPPNIYQKSYDATLVVASDIWQHYYLTEMSGNTSVAPPLGPLGEFTILKFRFADNGSQRSITWDAVYTDDEVPLPGNTTVGFVTEVWVQGNSFLGKWTCIYVNRGGTAYSGDGSTISIDGSNVVSINATYTGQTSITTLGPIVAGTWGATPIAPVKGGTGLTSYTTGDLIYASAANVLSKRGIGSSGDVLTVVSGVPAWAAPTGTTYTNGTGLSLTGNVFSIDAAYTGQSSIVTVGIIGAGAWRSSTPVGAAFGGTGIANNSLNTLTYSGNFGLTLTLSNTTSVTLPTAGTLATLAGTESFTNKTLGIGTKILLGSDLTGDVYFNGGSGITARSDNFNFAASGLNVGNATRTNQRMLRVGQGSNFIDLGSYTGGGFSAIYFDQATPGPLNYGFLGTTTATYLNSTASVNISVNDNIKMDFTATTITVHDGINISTGTPTGTIIGTTTSQKISFFAATPIVQPIATDEIGTLLSNLGLRAVGTAYPITTTGAVNFTTQSVGNNTTLAATTAFVLANSTKVYSGSFSQVGTATTTFTVTIGTTQANTSYKVNVTPTALLSAAAFYVTNKTTTTFDVVYLAGLTGTVTFDWILAP